MKKLLCEVSSMLKSGSLPRGKTEIHSLIRSMLLIIVVSVIFLFVSSLISISVFTVLNIPLLKSREFDLFKEVGFTFGILYISFIGPILEEIGFRFGLKYSNFKFSSMVTFLIFFIARKLFLTTTADSFNLNNNLLIMGLSLMTGFFMYHFLRVFKEISIVLSGFWVKNAKTILYFSFVSFSFFHIFNYKLSPLIFLFMPLITLPQLISGIMLSYTRLKYGIFYSIVLHIVMNSIASIKFFTQTP